MYVDFVDQQLVIRSQQGDMTAFAELINLYKQKIFTYAYRMVGNTQDAEDIAQETFLRVYRHLANYDPQRRFSTWVYAIANNLCIDQLRRRRPTVSLDQPLNDEGDLFLEPTATDGDPEHEVEQMELHQMVETAIASLPESYRSVIVLRHLQNLSYEEISRVLDLPLNTVKTRIFRAREALCKRLKDL